MKEKFFRRFLSTVSGFSLLFNSLFAPLTVLAQEVSPTPEPTPTTIEETASPSAEPTVEATISPTSEPTTEAIISATVEPTQVPGETILPTENPTQEPTQQTQEEQVQTNEPTSSSPSPTSSPTPEVKTVTAENTELNVSLLNDTKSTSLNEFDFSIQQDGSATLITDKADYAPTDTALITGNGFVPNKEYTIEITSTTGNFKFSDKVTSDESGGLFYPYQLDGTYRPDYKVEIKSESAVISFVTFTDSLLCTIDVNGANDFTGQKDLTKMCFDKAVSPLNLKFNWDEIYGSGENTYDGCSLWDTNSNGNANFSLCIQTLANPSSDIMEYNGFTLYSCGDDKSDRCTQPVNPVTATDTSCNATQSSDDPFPSGAASPQDTEGTCNINPANFGSSYTLLNVCSFPSGRPNSDPSDCVAEPTGGFISVIKQANPDDSSVSFNFNISGNSNYSFSINGSGLSNRYSVANGTYQVSESSLLGWNLDSAICKDANNNTVGVWGGNSVTNLSIDSGDDFVCTFTNSLKKASLTLVKKLIVNDGGTASIADWTLSATGPTNISGTSGNVSITNVSVNEGSYTLSESGGPNGYLADDWSCIINDESPVLGNNISLLANDIAICTITNDDIQPKLTVTKVVVNDNGGNKGVTDFPLFVGTTGSTISVTSGIQNGFNVGTYTISETDQEGYTETISGNCASNGSITLELGDIKSCTITNDDIAPSITLIKNVIKDNGGTAGVNDFGLTIGGVAANSGQKYSVDANKEYAIDEAGLIGYSFTSITGTNCPTNLGETIILNPGQDITCTITNDDIPGKIIVNKVTNPSEDPQKFDFTLSKATNSVDSFQLNDLDTPYDSG
ncbi:MAG: hypothetical protein Q7T59_04715, partial [Candidatus Woesebacteria bacterium]|nr:hypothetical protein [Candidatus Woesebacteria bacterium]